MKTVIPNPETIDKKWWLVDVANQPLGRAATRIATLLRGKHRPQFTPYLDTGDHVVVINADKVKLTGKKWQDKVYFRHSRYFGSLKATTAQELLEKDPAELLEKAVKGMLPTNKLSRKLIRKLKSYKGTEHPHQAQKLEKFTLS
ncbi:MAG TPA: 50S ribosomal protein L13 [Bdellovibrionales bacterium]|nr:50S ribosomal protein L13 [Bdellovibrionales bacterium]